MPEANLIDPVSSALVKLHPCYQGRMCQAKNRVCGWEAFTGLWADFVASVMQDMQDMQRNNLPGSDRGKDLQRGKDLSTHIRSQKPFQALLA